MSIVGTLPEYVAANESRLQAIFVAADTLGKIATPDSVLITDIDGEVLTYELADPWSIADEDVGQIRARERAIANNFVVTATQIEESGDLDMEPTFALNGELLPERLKPYIGRWVITSHFYYMNSTDGNCVAATSTLQRSLHESMRGLSLMEVDDDLVRLFDLVHRPRSGKPDIYGIADRIITVNTVDPGEQAYTFFSENGNQQTDGIILRALRPDSDDAEQSRLLLELLQHFPGNADDIRQHYAALMAEARVITDSTRTEQAMGLTLPGIDRLDGIRALLASQSEAL